MTPFPNSAFSEHLFNAFARDVLFFSHFLFLFFAIQSVCCSSRQCVVIVHSNIAHRLLFFHFFAVGLAYSCCYALNSSFSPLLTLVYTRHACLTFGRTTTLLSSYASAARFDCDAACRTHARIYASRIQFPVRSHSILPSSSFFLIPCSL